MDTSVGKIRGWVVRLKNNDLALSSDKPYYYRLEGETLISCENSTIIDNRLYPKLKWGDEPIEVECLIREI